MNIQRINPHTAIIAIKSLRKTFQSFSHFNIKNTIKIIETWDKNNKIERKIVVNIEELFLNLIVKYPLCLIIFESYQTMKKHQILDPCFGLLLISKMTEMNFELFIHGFKK